MSGEEPRDSLKTATDERTLCHSAGRAVGERRSEITPGVGGEAWSRAAGGRIGRASLLQQI